MKILDALVRNTKRTVGVNVNEDKEHVELDDRLREKLDRSRYRMGSERRWSRLREPTTRVEIHHLFRAISRAALINGASVHSGSAIAKNGCCRSCVASGRFSASTSSDLAR